LSCHRLKTQLEQTKTERYRVNEVLLAEQAKLAETESQLRHCSEQLRNTEAKMESVRMDFKDAQLDSLLDGNKVGRMEKQVV
jgi:hypothetical protein